MLQRAFWLATAAFAITGSSALAQPAPAQRPAPPARQAPATGVGEVIIQGAPPPVRTSIDRQSYSVAGDLQATTGSIGDALRNVPSVEVDVNGNVSLRGDSSVTILIDGKPSGMFKGEGKGLALQNLPADRIDRVEVITNPSAAFDPEGSGGVINLVTKKDRKLGYTASVRANIGSMGRQNGGVSGSRTEGKFTFSGDLSYRHDSLKQEGHGERATFDAAANGFRQTVQDTIASGAANVLNGRIGVDYDPDAKTRVSAELRGLDVDFANTAYDVFDETSALGVPTRGYDRTSTFEQGRKSLEGTLSYRRKEADDHELYVSVSRELNDEDRDRPSSFHNRLPSVSDTYENIVFDGRIRETLGKVEYSRPLPGEAKLKVGYNYDADDNDYDYRGVRGATPDTAVPVASLTNLFKFDQQAHAVFGTYERPFGDVTVLAGLRLEAVMIDLDQVTQNIQAENDYVRLYPSLHLRYELTENQQLRASYARRIQRPMPLDYNPFRVYLDPQNFREGNPDLKPAETDSFEFGYQYRKAGATYLATLYYRDVSDAVNDVTRDIGGGVFLTRRENIGESRSAGLELVANGRLTRRLTYNVSGNAFWAQLDGRGLGFGSATRDAVTVTGRGNLSWEVTKKDFLQVNGFVNGKRLTPQGYAEPFGMLNLGYRHKFNDRISGVVTVQDVLGTFRDKRVIDTPTLKDVQRYKPNNRGIFVGLTWSFGGRQRDPGFDFGGGPPGN